MNFKNMMKKENMMPVIVLLVICLAVALIMGVVNMFTAPEIERQQQEAIDASLKIVLPEGKNFEAIELSEDFPDEVKSAYKADGGYVFELSVRGKEAMTVMCGVNSEGKIAGVEVISESETPGYKEKILPLVTGAEGKYNGKDSTTLEPELASGATLTSNAIYKAVKASVDAYTVATGGEVEKEEETLPKTDSEITALASEMLGVSADTLTNVTPEGTELVKRVYRDKGGKNYAVYTVVISSHYDTVETETLVIIGNNGAIKGIKKLAWNTSDAAPEYGYNPPSDSEVDAFYNGLVGKDSETLCDVDLKTGATNTTKNMVDSLAEAIEKVKELAKKDMPTEEEKVIVLSAELLGTDAASLVDVTPDGNEYVRRIYRDKGGKGYAVYAAVISSYYGTVESETLVHVDLNGAIKGIKKLAWNTSDAVPEYGYNPPSASEVDAFYNGLVGKDSGTIGSVDLKTGATNTTKNMVDSVIEGLEDVDALLVAEASPLPRIVGIAVLSVSVIGFLAYLIVPKFIKRREIL